MRVLVLNQAFYPDVVSTAQHASDLALAMARAGHEVTVLCSSRGYDNLKLRFPHRETWNGVKIVRVRTVGFGKESKWRRAVGFAVFIASCVLHLCFVPQFDVVVAMTSPPVISFIAALAVPYKARRLVFWSMDLNPDEAVAAGWLRENSLAAKWLSRMLLYSLQRADRVIALDRFMKERIEAKGINEEKILVIPPWAHDDYIKFDPAGRQEFRARHELSDKFVVMHSGNHSPCHPLSTLLEAAERLADREDIVFCFIGGGSEFRKIQERIQERRMRNVLTYPYQPINKLAASLSAADLQVVVMGDRYVGIVHPCKIYNILAANRAFLYIGPMESHVRDIVGQADLEAYSCSHGDVDGVVRHILRAMHSRSQRARRAAEFGRRFSKEVLVPQMVRAIEQRVNGSGEQPLEVISRTRASA